MLHLTKVAVSCPHADHLAKRLQGRAVDGESWIVTRYRPTRHEELIGGSLYWIIKHQLVARSRIIGFAEADGKWRITLDADLVPVRIHHRRAHQGWRYLTAEDAPADLDGETDDLATLPPRLMGKLAALGLI
jgi:hypothetical protein